MRLARHGGLAVIVLVLSLALGTIGFHFLGPEEWIDAFLNASMLLGGMGPTGKIELPAGKIFASFYALYAGMVFLGISALFLAPILHRVLHRLHLDEKQTRRRG